MKITLALSGGDQRSLAFHLESDFESAMIEFSLLDRE